MTNATTDKQTLKSKQTYNVSLPEKLPPTD